jgi:hypothetical protein
MKIKWAGYEWLTEERWGQIHPDKELVWYDETAVKVITDTEVHLHSHWKPKKFKNLFGNYDLISYIGIGLISCTERFGYGRFTVEAMLPNTAFAWPAFWMWSWDRWPPEIDVFEGYSNSRGKYWSSFWDIMTNKLWRVETNIHLGKTPDNYSIGTMRHFLGYKQPSEVWNKYSVLWTPNEISFWYNDTMIRWVQDKSVLSQFENTTMNVILNNSVYKMHKSHETQTGVFKVRNFNYERY